MPVLSDAITVALPSVSTAVSRRTIAPRAAISRAPSASAIVTVAASPSGTAATATETPTRNASSSEDPRASIAPPSASVTTTPKPTIRRVSAPTRRCSGVGGGFARSVRPAISPSSVADPVAVTSARRSPACHGRPRVDHRGALGQRRSSAHPLDRLVDGHGLAGQRRLVDREPGSRDQPSVRRHPLALAQDDEIAGDDLLDADLALAAGADHARAPLEHVAEREHRSLGSRFLDEAEQRVEDHDRRDRRRLDPFADQQRRREPRR